MSRFLTKWLGLSLVLLMLVFSVVSCKPGKEPDAGTSGSVEDTKGTDGTGETPNTKWLHILKDNSTEYVIVRAVGAKDWEVELSVLFRDTIQKLTGIAIPIIDDYENADTGDLRTAKEIIIGTTNREDEYSVDYDKIGDGYRAFVSNEKLVFASKSYGGLFLAIQNFFENTYSIDVNSTELKKLDYTDLSVSATYMSMKSFKSSEVPFMDVVFEDYTVSYAKSNYMQKRMALLISASLKSATGISVKCVETDMPEAASVVLHTTKADGSKIESGNWELDVSGKTINVRASDYYGFGGASYYLETSFQHGYYKFRDGFSTSGDYLSSLNALTASDAYAYNRAGNIRVMFNNVLWQSRTPSGTYDDVPAAERNLLQAQTVTQYMPDVLGLQELDASKREACGDNNLVKLLETLGYAETIDPHVSNTSGVNCTPLFYNAATTKLIESGFYWYKAQDSNASSTDKSSKSLTWGVFESKATGDWYIVISTHMCTRNDSVRGQQAEEAVTLIKTLVDTYHRPVFIGGDFNGRSDAQNYRYFMNNGFSDAQKEAAVSSDTNTHKSYPQYDSDLGLMRPNANAVKDPDSIDRILMTNASDVELNVFGVVVDDCTLSASDHLPIFIDFSVSSEVNDDAEWSNRY